MVTFSHTPYSEALKIGDRQEAIMQHVMQTSDIEDQWDSKEVELYMLEQLN
jgi:kynurenine 3-monooxygenase